MCKSLLVFRCNYVCLVLFLRYSASNNGVTLKSGLAVIHSRSLEMVPFDRSHTDTSTHIVRCITNSGFDSRYIHLRYKVTSGDTGISAIKLFNFENIGTVIIYYRPYMP